MDKPSFVALSKFVIANEMEVAVKDAFVARPHLVDSADGFVRMDVLSPHDQPKEIWLITYWRDKTAFEAWHKSHVYHESHKGIPKGLKLRPSETEMRYFDLVAS
jgi:heme-degrading monooxygenase HmoA